MIDIILITKEPVIIKIFTLICTKYNYDLTISDTNYINQEADLIIVDHPFIDDHFNLIKQYSKRLGAITNEDLPFEKAKDFVLNRPFLPSQLEISLAEQIKIIEEKELHDKQHRSYSTNFNDEDLDIIDNGVQSDENDPSIVYLNDLAEEIADSIDDDTLEDESIIRLDPFESQETDESKKTVLDTDELSKIQKMLKVNEDLFKKINITSAQDLSKEDWQDLAHIIDKAIDDVKEYEFSDTQDEDLRTIELTLNKFAMDELRPLFEKLDQNIIDHLAEGNDVNLHLKLKD